MPGLGPIFLALDSDPDLLTRLSGLILTLSPHGFPGDLNCWMNLASTSSPVGGIVLLSPCEQGGLISLLLFPSSHFLCNFIFSFAKPLSKNCTLLYNLKSKTLLCQQAMSVWHHSSFLQQRIQTVTYPTPAEPERDLTATSADTEVMELPKSLTPS